MSHERVVPTPPFEQRDQNIARFPTYTHDTTQDATLRALIDFRTHLIDLRREGIKSGTLFVFNEDSIRDQLSKITAPKTQSAVRS